MYNFKINAMTPFHFTYPFGAQITCEL